MYAVGVMVMHDILTLTCIEWDPTARMLARWRLNRIPIRQSGLPFRVTDSDWLVCFRGLDVQSLIAGLGF